MVRVKWQKNLGVKLPVFLGVELDVFVEALHVLELKTSTQHRPRRYVILH